MGGGLDTSAFMMVCRGIESMDKTFFRWFRLSKNELALRGRLSGAAGRGSNWPVFTGAGRRLTAEAGRAAAIFFSCSPPGIGPTRADGDCASVVGFSS